MSDSDITALPENGASPGELPALAPDFYESEHADRIDNAVPSIGYAMVPVVGLGGSAGGITALRAFFDQAPSDGGVAYVVVLHLDPTHESTLAELLQQHTDMPVAAATDGMKFESDHVYVIPPDRHLLANGGHVQLTEFEHAPGKRVVIDLFFRSLADSHGTHATAVVLSGADGDGAIGLKRIKERGGLTIAQDPQQAEHPRMPSAAIATGMVDWVLPASDMAHRIVAYYANAGRLRLPPEEGEQPARPLESAVDESEALLREVLSYVHTCTGSNFTYYKRATIVRRIARRMLVIGAPELASYLDYLRTHSGEAGALVHDLLISVTNFFRDRSAFEDLQEHIPDLFRDKSSADSIRVWCAACATGEEAYSIAILLLEHVHELKSPPTIQIYGCDLNEEAIQVARAGLYPDTISADVSADVSDERLCRFFTREASGWRVRRELRDMVLFTPHDLLRDPPFSRMDLISCRNLMIYLNRDAQGRALDIFHFALKPSALLFLGTSESVAERHTLFEPVHPKYRLYQRRSVNRVGIDWPVSAGNGALQHVIEQHERLKLSALTPTSRYLPPPSNPPFLLRSIYEQRDIAVNELHFSLMGRFGPASVIVNADYEITHLSDNANRFLTIPKGEPSHNLMRLVHPRLRLDLRRALQRAGESGQSVDTPGRQVALPSGEQIVSLQVTPAGDLAPGWFLVIFKRDDSALPDTHVAGLGSLVESEALVDLDRALTHANAMLRSTVEKYESSTEELKAGNEELQSMNEELRSGTEELETSREELQSLNEELATVNSELKSRVEELARVNSDLQNLMRSTQIATVFLDRELRVMRYTPPAAPLFNLIPGDIGRPITDLKHQLDYPELGADAEQVLHSLAPVERELHEGGRWYLSRVLPYRTVDDHIAGVVLTLIDITDRKKAEAALAESENRYRVLFSASPAALLIVKPDAPHFTITELNDAYLVATMRTRERVVGRGLFEAFPDNPDDATIGGVSALRASFETVLASRQAHAMPVLKYDIARPDGSFEERWWKPVNSPVLHGNGQVDAIIHNINDVTAEHRAAVAIRASEESLQIAVVAAELGTWDLDLTTDFSGRRSLRHDQIFGYDQPQAKWGREIARKHVVKEDWEIFDAAFARAMEAGELRFEVRVRWSDGGIHWMACDGRIYFDESGKAIRAAGVNYDITTRRQVEEALHHSEERYRMLFEASPLPFVVTKPDAPHFTVVGVNDAYLSATMRTREALVGHRLFEEFPDTPTGGTSSVLLASFERVLATRRQDVMPVMKYDIARPDGRFEERWWIPLQSPVIDDNGVVEAIIHSALDITEIHRAGEVLRASEERQAFLLKVSDALRSLTSVAEIEDITTRLLGTELGADRVLFAQIEGALGVEEGVISRQFLQPERAGHSLIEPFPERFVYSSFGAQTMAGRYRGEILVVADIDTSPGFEATERATWTAASVRAAIVVPLARGGRLLAELGVHCAAPRGWTNAEVSLVQEVGERALAAVERAHTAAALQEGEARWRGLFEGMSEGFFTAEVIRESSGQVSDFRFLLVNPAFQNLTGVPPEQAVGRALTEVIPGALPDLIKHYGRVVDTGVPAEFEFEMQVAALNGRWYEVRARRTAPDQLSALFNDVTERKQTEEGLRTADRRKNEFIATLAHELRNPLAPLRTGLSVLERIGSESADAARTRQVMNRQLTQLVRLVDDLLDVSRVSRGEVVLKKSVISLQSVVDLALETSRPLLEAAGHHLRVDLPGEPVLLNADATRIAQVLSNMLNNAAKYTPNGGQVHLRVERAAPERVRLQLEDNGTGIPADMLESVFDLFTQVEHASERSQGGLGIGLSLSRRLIEMHGGTLRASSAGLGQGSTFTVELPAMPLLQPDDMPQPDSTVQPVTEAARKSVLVVDDNVDAAEMLAMAMRLDGQDVRIVHTGNDALTAFGAGEAPDVVFLDIGLPDLSGYEVAEELRRRQAFDHTVIVALTGWGAEHDKQRAFAAGFDLHLTKPVSPNALLTALASGRRSARGSV